MKRITKISHALRHHGFAPKENRKHLGAWWYIRPMPLCGYFEAITDMDNDLPEFFDEKVIYELFDANGEPVEGTRLQAGTLNKAIEALAGTRSAS